MSAAVLKGLLALAGACVFLVVSAALSVLRRDLGSALLATGMGWFGVMALTHFFESFSILPAFGWGRPHSVGHFIDLAATVLGITFLTVGVMVYYSAPFIGWLLFLRTGKSPPGNRGRGR